MQQRYIQHAGANRSAFEGYTYISGPTSITYHPKVHGRDFYIFGDLHAGKEEYCGSEHEPNVIIEDFLERSFLSTPNKIDFYLESPFISKKRFKESDELRETNDPYSILEYSQVDAIQEIQNKFQKDGCFKIEKQECRAKYPNVRFHYADFRSQIFKSSTESEGPLLINSFWTTYPMLLSHLKNNMLNPETPEDIEVIKENKHLIHLFNDSELFKEIITKYFQLGPNAWARLYIQRRMLQSGELGNQLPYWEILVPHKENRIKKELESVPPNIREALNSYIADKAEEYGNAVAELRESFPKAWEIAEKSKFTNIEPLAEEMHKKIVLWGVTGAIFMDVYMWSRIFKPSLSDSDQIWVYAGEFHCKNLRHFIKSYLGYDKIERARPIARRCQDVRPLTESPLEELLYFSASSSIGTADTSPRSSGTGNSDEFDTAEPYGLNDDDLYAL